jgi:hypothetical protein
MLIHLYTDRKDSLWDVAFALASKCGSGRIVSELLLDNGVDPAYQNSLSIRLASFHGHLDVVQMLLSDFRVAPGEALGAASAGKCVCIFRRRRRKKSL